MKLMLLAHAFTAIGTIFSPLVIHEFILPYIFHPYRLGGVPFDAPSPIKYTTMYLFCLIVIIGFLATISDMMATARECRKVEFVTSFINAKWPMFFALLGTFIIFCLPLIKAPLLVLMAPIPFSNLLTEGIILSLFVIFGHFIGINYNIRDTCLVPLST